ncbi:hypothetical protein [Aquirufa nivalisilvae]
MYAGKSTTLLKYLVREYGKLEDDNEKRQYHLKAINELTLYAVEKQDEHLQKTLLEFYERILSEFRNKNDKKTPLIYPRDIYFIIHRLNIESVNNENKKLRGIERRAVNGSWLLGDYIEEITVSDETYNWLWNNLFEICDNPRLIKMFWSNSSQFFDLSLQVRFNYSTEMFKSQDDINFREKERKQFLEFHYALGGLLLYRKQYNSIRYIYEYTQSSPPRYVLLPERMEDIFFWIENFRNEYLIREKPIEYHFPFPELDNYGNNTQIRYWICSYISILFIRQFSLNQYYVFQDFTKLPDLPSDISKLRNLHDTIYFFEKCLNDILQNKDLLSSLKFENVVELNKLKMRKFIKKLKQNVTSKLTELKLKTDLSGTKINEFYQSTSNVISKAFEEYDSIFVRDEDVTKCDLKLSINGAQTLMDKSAFTDSDTPYLNFESVFAKSIVLNRIKRDIPNSFLISKTKRYSLSKNLILKALEKLIGNNQEVMIIGVNISYSLKTTLQESVYNRNIIYIPSIEYDFNDVLFVLDKKHFPIIKHVDLQEKELEQLKLVQVNPELKIYASVIDINSVENEVIKANWNLDKEANNSNLKIQLAIAFLSIIYWKKEREIVQINIASEFNEQGIQDDISEVLPLKQINLE